MTGRNPEHPTWRKKGLPTEQRIEFVQTELANALTTVQKDNLVLEKEEHMTKKYRIRKLTEKECWRLMGYKDADYNKVAEVISACQRYKTAGNAIVKQVLMAIFLQMGIQGKKRWNSMDAEEKRFLVNGSLDFLKLAVAK
jgi:site-specific DNA-cytosine methylase